MIPPRFLNAIAWLELEAAERPLDEHAYEAARLNASMSDDVWLPPVELVSIVGPVTITFHGWGWEK